MKTLKRFTLAVSLTALAFTQALPCGDYDAPTMYNHFHCVKEMPSIKDKTNAETVEFWAHYTGQNAEDIKYSVCYLPVWQFEEEEPSNDLLRILKEQGKTDAIELLRLSCKLYDLQDNNSWDYKKTKPSDYEALLNKIDALKVTGELNRRKTFLKMRCLFSLKDYTACLRLWDNFASKWEPSGLRQRMEGYVAGVYCRRKEYAKAIPMFFELGDDLSIQYCVNRMLASTTIEQEYANDPNSPILGYILEDYANYYYHAMKNDNWEHGKENPIWTVVTDDAQRNIALAERVVSEGKAKDLQMWKAFAGFLQMVEGQYETAYHTFEQAEKLPQRGVVGPCLRAYKFMAALQMEQKAADFDSYLLSELRYWKEADENNTSEEERSTLYSFYEYDLTPQVIEYVASKGDERLTYVAQSALQSYGVKWAMDRDMTLEQVLAIKDYMQQAPQTPLEAYMKEHSTLKGQDVCFDEFIGTKLMRLGRYEEAAEYLAQVPQDYIRNQGISNYLRVRKMPAFGFDRVQYAGADYAPELNNENYKLLFCKRIVGLQNILKSNTGEVRAKTALEIAKWLFQGSIAGDMWGISEYSWSSYGAKFNELDQQAVDYLLEALRCTKDYNTQVECNYGLAAIGHSDDGPYCWNRETGKHMIAASGTQLQGYQWLKADKQRTHEIYDHCDWLKLYVTESMED